MVANDRRQTGVVNCCWVWSSLGGCGVSSTWERGSAGVNERVEKSHQVGDSGEGGMAKLFGTMSC